MSTTTQFPTATEIDRLYVGTIRMRSCTRWGSDEHSSFVSESPEAYERLILDAMRGDATLFTRGDEIEAQWRIIDPILTAWHEDISSPIPQYPAGSPGPREADALLGNGRRWRRL